MIAQQKDDDNISHTIASLLLIQIQDSPVTHNYKEQSAERNRHIYFSSNLERVVGAINGGPKGG